MIMKRKFIVIVPGALFLFAAMFLLASFTHLTSTASFDLGSVKSSLNKWLPSGHSPANTTGEYRGPEIGWTLVLTLVGKQLLKVARHRVTKLYRTPPAYIQIPC
jgi:hypothetical protein